MNDGRGCFPLFLLGLVLAIFALIVALAVVNPR